MVEWDDRQGHRDRKAWALLITTGRVLPFTGSSIPGMVAVLGTTYRKDGKWSHTTYRLELAAGVRLITGRDGWEQGSFAEGLAAATGSPPIDRWEQMAGALGVGIAEARRFLAAWRVGTADRPGAGPRAIAALDAAEAALASVDDAVDADAVDAATAMGAGTAQAAAPEAVTVEVLSVSFGSPTNRRIREGFWSWPVRVLNAAGAEVGRVTPSPDWDSPVVVGSVAIVANEATCGMHGGYRSLRLAAPTGCVAAHGLDAVIEEEPPTAPAPSSAWGGGAMAEALRRAGR